MEKEISLAVKKLGRNGEGVGNYKGREFFCYGVLPNEIAKVRIIKKNKKRIETELVKLIEKSKERIKEKENHFLSCSPLQILSYDKQIEYKKKLLKDAYSKFKNIRMRFFPSSQIYGYRTKMEFSFEEKNGKIFLAFYKRGNYKEKYILEKGCVLASKEVNKIALDIVNELNKKKVKGEKLKSLVIREGKRTGERIAVLYVKDENFKFEYENDMLKGFMLVYSDPKSPASIKTKILFKSGEEELREKILNREFVYSPFCFFQNNISLFEKAIKEMKKYTKRCKRLLDVYCGVGTIGICLTDGREVVGVEIEDEEKEYAKLNAEINNIKNYKILNINSKKLDETLIENFDCVILDPPRAGLTKKLISKILKAKPLFLIYLSCNPFTQAKDYELLRKTYKICIIEGFDFYPHTPHLESLLILKLKNT